MGGRNQSEVLGLDDTLPHCSDVCVGICGALGRSNHGPSLTSGAARVPIDWVLTLPSE
jgi:hypothetical protein